MLADTHAPLLAVDRTGPIATLTLNRPASRNALSLAMLDALIAATDELGADQAVRVVVLAGAGPAFCAGHDLKEIRANPDPEFRRTLFHRCADAMLALTRLPQPVIARVHGMATAAGCQLVATADLAVASTVARFATPGVSIGLFCSTPMVALTRAIGPRAAAEMLYTGAAIDAETARAVGLVNRVVAESALDDAVATLAQSIASRSRLTLALGKRAYWHQRDLPLEAAYRYAADQMAENLQSCDAGEGIDAFLTRRDPVWQDR
ncbi:MAG: enoyl-CoA hydratase [Alphaproteobacteria bacterium]|nr:MAG: enoyl-CoA hydratase [Alphaproteobacteria bacterium]